VIESSLNRVPQVDFNEDRARNRKNNGPENRAILCKFSLNLFRNARPNIPVSRKRKLGG
jgi:predicted transposase YbfD/YdcC